MSEPAQNQLAPEAPAGLVPSAGAARVAETLLLLTHDNSLIEALTGVVPQGCLALVRDEAALAAELMSGQAGVVFIDAGEGAGQASMTAQLAQRLHSQMPDVVLVVAGDGAAQSELAALVTDGTIYRFVHKPVSAQRVKLFVDAAWRKRDGTSSGASGLFPALSMSQTLPIMPMPRPVPWLGIMAGAAVIGVAALWYMVRPVPVAPSAVPAPAPNLAPVTTEPEQTAPAPVQQVLVTGQRPTMQLPVPRPVPVTVPNPIPDPKLSAPAPQRVARPRATRPAVMLPVPRPVPVTVPNPIPDPNLSPMASQDVARLRATRPAVMLPVPRPVPIPVPVAVPAPISMPSLSPVIAASPATMTDGPPTSTPPVSEARDPLSVAAVILERVYWVDPEFPEVARDQDLTGFVDLEFMVHADGSVTDVTVLKAQPLGVFEKSSVAAVRQWRYRPVERDGMPVDAHARLRLNFGYK